MLLTILSALLNKAEKQDAKDQSLIGDVKNKLEKLSPEETIELGYRITHEVFLVVRKFPTDTKDHFILFKQLAAAAQNIPVELKDRGLIKDSPEILAFLKTQISEIVALFIEMDNNKRLQGITLEPMKRINFFLNRRATFIELVKGFNGVLIRNKSTRDWELEEIDREIFINKMESNDFYFEINVSMADVSPAVRVNFLMEEEYFKDSTYLEDVYELRFPNEFMLQLLESGLFASRQYEWAIELINNSTIYEECLTKLKGTDRRKAE
ncbi:hypothetical protein P4679_35140 [Priestia megaterium]|uniref:hypothetical protein n=2 Tax=Priestia megaterium TaxID=1404 RepID=UPI002E216381|nr:hypothetical protein [Priestia megaterium]